jgi:uncharacterized protein (TIGR00255 family)
MPQSMTGFAAAEASVDPFRLSWEIRSVNHRFLDLSFRLPDEIKPIELACRDVVASRITRGKLECSLRVSVGSESSVELEVDDAMLAAMKALQQRVHLEFPDAKSFSVPEVLRWPGVIREPKHDLEVLTKPVLESLEEAVDGLVEVRCSEGGRIAELLLKRVGIIDETLASISPLISAAEARYREKLLARLDKIDIVANPERLEQELALIAQRLDISEEVDRLGSHTEEIGTILAHDGPAGRRLDFVIQELNREANTLASKAQDEELTRLAVDLKVLIEQMREQAQNLE